MEYKEFSIEDIDKEDADFFENLGIHQKLKHKFMEIYLDIWAKNVGYNSKKTIPTVDFFDLYAASGWAYDQHTEDTWPGSALLAAKAFGEYPKGRLLLLNSFDPNSSKCQKQIKILQQSIKDLEDCPHVIEKTKIISEDIHKATDIALRELNRNFPSLWILDPYHPNQLPWEIVERISSTVGEPYKNRVTGEISQKKPELIINLMTSILQRNMDRKPELFSKSIGMPEQEWRPIYKKYEQKYIEQGNEKCTRQVILDIYADRLSKLYKREPIIALVNAAEGGVVYTMLLVTDNDAGYHMMRKKMHDWNNYKVYKWKPEAEVSMFKKHNPNQLDLKKWVKL